MREIVLPGKYALYLDGYQRLIMLYYNDYNVLLLPLQVVVLILRTYRVDDPHEWCGGLARMVRRIKHIVIYRRERDKLLANTKERMYLCCGNSGATIVRHLTQIGYQILNLFCFILEQMGCLQGAGVAGYVKL